MGNVLFTNVRILDGTGAQPFAGEVLVQGNRILKVGRGPRSLPTTGIDTIDAAGATLMPGMTEAHTHFSWNDQPSLGAIQKMPLEEHILWCAHIAERYLSRGFTSCVGAACAKPRLDVATRNSIDSGLIPPAGISISVAVFGGGSSSSRSREGGRVCGRERRSNLRPLALVKCFSTGGPT